MSVGSFIITFNFILYVVSGSEDHQDFNVTLLIHKSFLICGRNYICDYNAYDLPDISVPVPTAGDLCPPCYCDTECFKRRDCCPDAFFKLPKFDFLPFMVIKPEETVTNYFMSVSYCPSTSDDGKRDLCTKKYSPVDFLSNLPVTSQETKITYRNMHCAYCHEDRNVSTWSSSIRCKRNVDVQDFYFMSKLTTVVEGVKDRGCILERHPPPDGETYMEDPAPVASECNVTGTWTQFDENIVRACRSKFQHRFGSFKNIFCFMCNPPVTESAPLISSCNITGKWQQQNAVVKEACRTLPYIQGVGRYKNIFCFICNSANNSSRWTDVDFTMEEEFENKKFKYNINIHKFMIDIINQAVFKKKPSELFTYWTSDNVGKSSLFKTPMVITRGKKLYNTSKLLQSAFAVNRYEVCNEEHFPQSVRTLLPTRFCECNPQCLFDNKCKCCLDVGLSYPTSCYSDKILSLEEENGTSVLLTDGCYVKDKTTSIDSDLERLCIQGNDTLSNIYVTDSTTHIPYKNIFCYLCNHNYDLDLDKLKNLGNYMPWMITMSCPKTIDFTFTNTLLDKMDIAKDIGCDVELQGRSSVRVCEDSFYSFSKFTKPNLIDRCNTTGLWSQGDADIQWACEGLLSDNLQYTPPYKNIFCKLCNPTDRMVTDTINHCETNVTSSLFDPAVVAACEILPNVPSKSVYKNRFCEQCNNNFFPSMTFLSLPIQCECDRFSCQTDVVGDIPPMFRDIFTYNVITHELTEQDNAKAGHVIDYVSNKQREVICFPGKHLKDGVCAALLPFTVNMRYGMTILLQKGKSNSILQSPDQYLSSVVSKTFEKLKEFSNVDYQLISADIFTPLTCRHLENTFESTIDIFVYFDFFHPWREDRNKVETSLTDIIEGKHNLSVKVDNDTLYVRPLKHSGQPSVILYEQLGGVCTQRIFGHITPSFIKKFRILYVNKFLLCKQIAFSKTECDFTLLSGKLLCKEHGFQLSVGDFIREEDGSYRVCIDDVLQYFSKKIPEEIRISIELGYLTHICILISLVCMAMTLFTYTIFKDLRTTPGILTMSLVFSIFSSQIIFTYGVSKIYLGIYCVIIGLASHYFWLCMFVCSSICSFHMHMVFKNIHDGKLNTISKCRQLVKYLLFSYMSPIVVIACNSLVHYLIGNGSGYGNGICFLSDPVSRVVTVIVPGACICLINFVLFVKTTICIRSLPDVTSSKKQINYFTVFVKLFTITGLLWSLQLLESLIPNITLLTYFTSVLNGLQGLFIFLSYVCNKNVLNLYISLCKKSKLKEKRKATMITSLSSSQNRSNKQKSTNINAISFDRI